ncbi:MAG: MFS transporter [Pseudolysinimonas sp.]|uniref:MFS transporter n=1 Tax=Pseudolysinimonas sp. TaxID=2680009 RepID=UPI003264B988
MAVRLPRALHPFRTRQYRILTTALVISMLGAGTWIVSLVFQVKALGGSPSDLSFVAALNALGLVAAVLIAGAVADRVPQKRILIVCEATKVVGFAAAAVLGLTGTVEIWQLAVISLALGIVDGFFYPAYSALLPSILPADDLLPANGLEGTLRPVVVQAAGPLLASILIAAWSPALAFGVVACVQLIAVAALLFLHTTPVRRDISADAGQHPVAALLVDIRDGMSYMVRTPWLFGTLLFACLWVLVVLGPIEVLLPFAVTGQTGGGAGAYAIVLAAYGAGGAIASLIVASNKLPRRYLTTMNVAWGLSTLPLVVIGITNQLWLMAALLFVVGAGFAVGGVIWGTLLQRRVPPAMLGRVSSLDFFVSLALMPVSMAIAGPIGEAIGFEWAFLAAGVIPAVLAVVTIVAFRMRRDEIANPLEPTSPLQTVGAVESGDSPLS